MISKLKNARQMADNLMACPCNEQNLGNAFAAIAQAIRDLADAIENVNDYACSIEFGSGSEGE